MKNIPTKPNDSQEKKRAHENKRAKKGSGPETTKGARKRTEFGLSKGLNKGGANRMSRRGNVKPREPR